MTKSGAELGREHAARLENYLASIDAIPSRNGKPNITAIARACGFDRQVLYKNPACVALIGAAVAERSLDSKDPFDGDRSDWVPVGKLREAEKRNSTLEKKISELRARIVGLEALLRRRAIIDDELIARGRRSTPSSSAPSFAEKPE